MTKPSGPRLGVEQKPVSYASSCLPLTSEMAKLAKALLEPTIRNLPREWNLVDRVVALLVPSVSRDVENFYVGGGKSMAEMFETHQVERLDRDLLVRLCAKIEKLSPGFMGTLNRAVRNDDGGTK